jgi:hypothetical protein
MLAPQQPAVARSLTLEPALVRENPARVPRGWGAGSSGTLLGRVPRIYFFAERAPLTKRTDTAEVSAMRVNIWLVLAVLIGITRYTRHHQQTPHLCLDERTRPGWLYESGSAGSACSEEGHAE